MSTPFIAMAIGVGFLLGLRVGLALGHRNARKKREREDRAARVARGEVARKK